VEEFRPARPVFRAATGAVMRDATLTKNIDDSVRHHWARNLAVTFVTEHLGTRFHYQQDAGQMA
jgi:hypothetical protein